LTPNDYKLDYDVKVKMQVFLIKLDALEGIYLL